MVSQYIKRDRLSAKQVAAISKCLGCDLHVGCGETKSALNVSESRFALLLELPYFA